MGQIYELNLEIVGKPEAGFALATRTTSRNTTTLPDGSTKEFSWISEMQVTELYSGPLDSALFEVPSGFRKVDEIRRNPPIPLSLRIEEYWNSFKLRLSQFFH